MSSSIQPTVLCPNWTLLWGIKKGDAPRTVRYRFRGQMLIVKDGEEFLPYIDPLGFVQIEPCCRAQERRYSAQSLTQNSSGYCGCLSPLRRECSYSKRRCHPSEGDIQSLSYSSKMVLNLCFARSRLYLTSVKEVSLS